MAKYEIQLGVHLETSDIQKQINAISNNKYRFKIDADVSRVQKQINSIKRQIQNLSGIKINLSGTGFGNSGGFGRTVSETQKAYQDLKNLANRINGIRVTMAGLDASKNSGQISELSTQLNRLMTDYNNLYQTFSKGLNFNQLNALKSEINSVETELNQLRTTEQLMSKQGIDTSQTKANIKSLEMQLSQLRATYQSFSNGLSINQIDNLQNAFQIATDKISALNAKMADTSAQQRQNQANAELRKSFQDLLSMANQISNLEFQINGLKIAGGHDNELEVLENQLRSLKIEYERLVDSFNNGGGINSGIFDIGDFQKLNNAISESEVKIERLKAELADKIKLNIDTDIANNISKVHSDFDKLSNKTIELKQKLDLIDNIKIDLDTAKANNDIDGLINANKEYERVLKDIKTQIDINARAEKNIIGGELLDNKKVGLMADMNKWLKDNSAAADQFGDRLKELQVQLSKCTTEADFKRVSSGFNTLKKEAGEAGVATKTLGDKLRDQFSKYSSYLSVASVFMYVTQAMKDMFNQVVAIDSAMTELKKVTDETASSYDQFLTNAASRAKEIGTTIDGLVASTADFARLGYNFKDAQGLAEVANIYAVVGDEVEGVEGATESLISTMAAFKDEAVNVGNTDFAMGIVDKFNEIGKLIA